MIDYAVWPVPGATGRNKGSSRDPPSIVLVQNHVTDKAVDSNHGIATFIVLLLMFDGAHAANHTASLSDSNAAEYLTFAD